MRSTSREVVAVITLAQRRMTVGYTQAELSEELGLDQVTVAKWEHGRSMPSNEMISKLANILEMDSEQVRAMFKKENRPNRANGLSGRITESP